MHIEINGKKEMILNNAYSYDRVDNVLSVANSAANNNMAHAYDYDGLYRLVSATGDFAGANNKTASYTLEMAYDNLHNITNKKQHVAQAGIQFDGVLKAGYELAYSYTNNPFQISTLNDDNYRTEGNVANDLTEKQHAYEYDANGNLVYVNTAREKKDGTKVENSTERKLLWDEENRLEAIDENGFVSNYWYDAAGERTVKTSGESEQMFVNALFSGGNTGTANFTAYVNPYIVVSKGGHYTKHIYIGSQRIVSKLGDLDSYGADPRRIEYAGANVDGALVDYQSKYEASQQTIKDRYAIFEVPYLGKDNDDYVNGQGFCCDDTPQGNALKAAKQNDNPELFQYYYHSDHLGSTSLITNLDGEVVQHVEYVPFGEVFIEERNNTWNTPYLFNAKELDEETGLYYYGARYYEPRTSVWLSADPMQEKYFHVSTYAYALQNPIKFIDPTGMDVEIDGADGQKTTYTQGMTYKGKDAHTSKTIQSLNQMNSTENGAIVLKELITSNNVFTITSNRSSVEGTAGFLKNDAGGGTLNMGSNTDLLSLAHELFHGHQHENGQGGASIFSEVEAYVFADIINAQYSMNEGSGFSGGSYSSSRNSGTKESSSFNKSMAAVIYGETFPENDFNNAVSLFKSESGANASGIYNNYPRKRNNQTKNLLERFYPLLK